MGLSKLLTIVIPCKNEKDIILKTLDLLNHQKQISGVKVVVCDSSDDGITTEFIEDKIKSKTDLFDLHLTDLLLACILFTLWWSIWQKK